ncbi:MAG: peptidoglycan DD-metalloendopeptidase family protein [Leptolyngbyaceae cyanobacterium]
MPDTQSQSAVFQPLQGCVSADGINRKVRTSFTVLGLALSLGAAGPLVSGAEAADSTQLAALPSVTGGVGTTLPSFGSSRPAGAAASYHTVSEGETIWDIATLHGLTVEDIRSANGIADDQLIQAGQVLKVPAVAEDAVALLDAGSAVAPEGEADISDHLVPPGSDLQTKVSLDEIATNKPQPIQFGTLPAESQAGEDLAVSTSVDRDGMAERLDRERLAETDRPRSLAALPASDTVQTFSEDLSASPSDTLGEKKVESTTEDDNDLLATTRGVLTHRVGSGETLWSIARTYGLGVEDLRENNLLSDTEVLRPGDELAIPTDQPLEVRQNPDVERLTYRQVSQDKPMPQVATEDASAIAVATESLAFEDSSGSTTTASMPVLTQAASTSVEDPFVEDLLSQADTLDSQEPSLTARRSPTEQASQTDAVAELEVASLDVEEPTETPAVNPQFVDNAGTSDLSDQSADELLAAAPLGSDIYAPAVESPTGRVVTPEMPVLPGQDAYLPEAPNQFDGYMWPAQGVLTSGYGWRWGRMHRGVDIAGPVGTPIYAAGPGVVLSSGWNSGGYGNMVEIRHPDGSMTRYAHNSRLMVSPGQEVRQGQQIAEMGSTGFSTGPHLHFEIHIPNQGTVNPMAMLPGR